MNMIEDQGLNLINVNYATEEELMTLPGIDRQTASSIIEYRRKIGGFKKVEEVALVSGVGAAKLSLIRDELTVSISRQASFMERNSEGNSLTGSQGDVSLKIGARLENDKKMTKSQPPKVNVNTSNVFQLMEVKGIGQVLAENIVTYRDKKGPFKTFDDLIKVKGIGNQVLSAITPYITLTNDPSSENAHLNINGNVPHGAGDANNSNSNTCGHDGMKLLSTSTENMLDVLGPFIKDFKESVRPKVTPFKFKHKNRRVVRIASWNLECCDDEKANNPGVRDVVCMTILENGYVT